MQLGVLEWGGVYEGAAELGCRRGVGEVGLRQTVEGAQIVCRCSWGCWRGGDGTSRRLKASNLELAGLVCLA